MNIVGSLGVLLTGDASGLTRAAEEGTKSLNLMQTQGVGPLSQSLSSLPGLASKAIGGSLFIAVMGAVRAWEPYEQKLAGLKAMTDDVFVVDELREYAKHLKDFAVIDSSATMRVAANLKQMGTSNDQLKETVQLVQSIVLASGGRISDTQAQRLIVMWKTGSTMLLERYVPALRMAATAEEKQAVLQNWIAEGFKRVNAEMNTSLGQRQRLHSTASGLIRTFGEMMSTMMQLNVAYGNLTRWLMLIRDTFEQLSPATKGWITALVWIVAVGVPVALILKTLAPLFLYLLTVVVRFAAVVFSTLLPAVAAVAAAFLGWNLGRVISSIQIGGNTIGGYMKRLSMIILEGWSWLWDIMPKKVGIAFTKVLMKMKEFAGASTESLKERLSVQEAALAQAEAKREQTSQANQQWLEEERKKALKNALRPGEKGFFKNFGKRFAAESKKSLEYIIDKFKEFGEKIGSGEAMGKLMALLNIKMPEIPIPEIPKIPEFGGEKQPGGKEGPYYAEALERGTAAAYSAEKGNHRELQEIRKSSAETASNTADMSSAIRDLVDMMPVPATL